MAEINVNTLLGDDMKVLQQAGLEDLITTKRRNLPLGPDEIKHLVCVLDIGAKRWGCVEKNTRGLFKGYNRLRFILSDANGKLCSKSLGIPDESTSSWVEEYIRKARKKRHKYKKEAFVRKMRTQYGENVVIVLGGKVLTSGRYSRPG